MKKVTYLCDCGAKNQIAAPRPEHRETALYYCGACGKPSHDLCQRCGYRSPVGSAHAYCQRCGAGSEAIRRGVASVNLARFRWELAQAVVAFGGVAYALQTWVMPYTARRAQFMAERHETESPLLLIGILLVFMAPALVIPIYTLLTGRKRPPIEVRALAQMGRYGDLDGLEGGFAALARRAHILTRKQACRLLRRFRRFTATTD